jgi:dihydrofolate reductase
MERSPGSVAFLRAGLITDLTVTVAPVLLGAGIALFAPSDRTVALVHRSTRVLAGGFVQSSYDVPAVPDGGGPAWPST